MQNKLKKLVVFMLIGCFILSCIPCTAASKEQEVINGSLTEEVPAEAETGATEGVPGEFETEAALEENVKPVTEAAPEESVKPVTEAAPEESVKPVAEAVPEESVKPAAEAVPEESVKPVAEAVSEGNSESVAVTYSITIPASVNLNDAQSMIIIASNVRNLNGQSITIEVTSENDSNLKSGKNKIAYSFSNNLSFTADGSQTFVLSISDEEKNGKPAGTYTDTLNFSASLTNVGE